ncbi:MAG: hypothetical protein WCR04_07675 [Fibrobacteraceae bacterium]
MILFACVDFSYSQASTSIWASVCGLTESNAQYAVSRFESICDTAYGGGSTFSGGISTDQIDSNGTWTYCAKYSCNGCTSAKVQAQKSTLTDSCTAECLTTNFICSATGAFTYNFNLADCSETPITTGVCAESSSSFEESSSSVEASSSMTGNEEKSSSSAQGNISSSSQNGQVPEAVCYAVSNKTCRNWFENQGYFLELPRFAGTPTFKNRYYEPSCKIVDGVKYLYLKTNIPFVYYTYQNDCYKTSACSGTRRTVYLYMCLFTNQNDCAVYDANGYISGLEFDCSSTHCTARNVTNEMILGRRLAPSNVTEELVLGIANDLAVSKGFSNIESFINTLNCTETSSSSSVTELSSSSVISSSSTSGGDSSGSVSSSSGGSSESSSSGGEGTGSSSSGSEDTSSSSGDLCPQHPLASVPADPLSACFSYGGLCYKCSSDRGSDCGSEWLWIYSFNSSNVGWWYEEVDCSTGEAAASSSSGVGECPSHPLRYVPSDPLNTCFSYGGTCYKCNPDRGSDCGSEWLWIYDFNASNVGWWYTEVDCYDPFEEEGQCPEEFYLQKSAAQSGGQPDTESSESSVELILQTKFYDALGRRLTNSPKPRQALYSLKTNTIRKMDEEISLTGESYVYIPIELFQGNSRALMKTSGTVESCGTAWNIQNDSICDSDGSWDFLGKKCGVEGVDYGVYNSEGGMDVGVYCGMTYFMPQWSTNGVLVKQLETDTIGTCDNGRNKMRVTFQIPVETRILRDYYEVAPVGYQFDDGFVVSDSLHDSIDWHEKGHQRFYHCLIDENRLDRAIVFTMDVCASDYTCDGNVFYPKNETRDTFNSLYKAGKKGLKNRDEKEWLQMCGWYHDRYGHADGPRDPDTHKHIDPYDISCPSAEELEQDYDLSGCESE